MDFGETLAGFQRSTENIEVARRLLLASLQHCHLERKRRDSLANPFAKSKDPVSARGYSLAWRGVLTVRQPDVVRAENSFTGRCPGAGKQRVPFGFAQGRLSTSQDRSLANDPASLGMTE